MKVYFVYAMVIMMVVLSSIATHAQSLDLEVDVNPLFDMINTFFPIIFAILVIPGGIVIAIYLGKFIINAMLGAFKGSAM